MTRMDGARRELQRLRDKLRADERDFRSAAPPLDEDGLPDWDGTPGLSLDGYTRALGDVPDAALSDEELETRERLAPYAAVFSRLEETEEDEP
jgi:hypothetical protein